jgi:gliding motility-associated-like protein
MVVVFIMPEDSDGDGISDFNESRYAHRDTDQDGIPDYLDLDSDNDNLTDAQEANYPMDLCSMPFEDCETEPNGIAEWIDPVQCIDFVIPEAFSPNGDGINDEWTFDLGQQFFASRILVFNRWGNKVYEADGPVIAWDGRPNVGTIILGDQQGKLPTGTYFYIIEFQLEGMQDLSGFVYINR